MPVLAGGITEGGDTSPVNATTVAAAGAVMSGAAAGGDLGGTYPNPSVTNDSHSHTAATLPAIPATAYKTADQTVNNSTALVSDTHLTATFASGKKYWFSFWARMSDATVAQAGGCKVALSGTAVLANLSAFGEIISPAVISAVQMGLFTALDQEMEQFANGEPDPVVRIEGTAEVTTGGTFVFKWAQVVATVGDLKTLKGSLLTYQEV